MSRIEWFVRIEDQARAERLKSKCTSPRQKQRLFRIEGGGLTRDFVLHLILFWVFFLFKVRERTLNFLKQKV